MAKGSRRRQQEADSDLDEVDTFNQNREKIFLDEAGEYGRQSDQSEDSEEEVMKLDDDQVDGDEESDQEEYEHQEDEELDEEEGWGSKQNYYGGEDLSDIEDEKQVTEEAIRQQKKHIQELGMTDYIDEDTELEWKKTAEEFEKKDVTDQLFASKDSEPDFANMSDKEKLAFLQTSFPEFIPLMKELTECRPVLQDFAGKKDQNEVLKIKYNALSSYLGAISSYFAIFVENIRGKEPFITMKNSPVMETLLQTREVWRQASELPEEDATEKSEDIEIDTHEVSASDEDIHSGSEEEAQNGELLDSASDFSSDEEDEAEKSKSEKQDHFDIDINAKRKIKKPTRQDVGHYDETEVPDDVDQEDKRRRRRTLRFYTSKIDQAASKNAQERLSGDLDVPYKERLFERQQRLIEEARKRGLGQTSDGLGADLDDQDADPEDEKLAESINDSTPDNGNDYYDKIKEEKEAKQRARREAHKEALLAAREGNLEELQETIGDDGKRAINYQILKNKGLTPHRKKDNRNSRVKKRKKYEKAQKKLKSVRQVYETPKGPYEGEKSGIKKGTTRSIKLV